MVDTRSRLTISQDSILQKIRAVSKARTLAEKSVQLSAIARAIEQQQNATDEIIELFWVSSGTNGYLDDVPDVFVRAPVPQRCQPLEPTSAMSSIMTRWSTSCFTILWRKGVYIPAEWSTSFSKRFQAIANRCTLEDFAPKAQEVLRKVRPVGKTNSERIDKSRVLQPQDLKDIQELLGIDQYSRKRQKTRMETESPSGFAQHPIQQFTSSDAEDLTTRLAEADSTASCSPVTSKSLKRDDIELPRHMSAGDEWGSSPPMPALQSATLSNLHYSDTDRLPPINETSDGYYSNRCLASEKDDASTHKRMLCTQTVDQNAEVSNTNSPLQYQKPLSLVPHEVINISTEQGSDTQHCGRNESTMMIKRLQPQVWLDDRTVFGIINLLAVQRSIRIHDVGNIKNFATIHQWNPSVVSTIDSRRLVIPLRLPNPQHWVLVELDCLESNFRVFDSMKELTKGLEGDIARVIQRIAASVEQVANFPSPRRLWTDHSSQSEIPQQTNTYDCGIYVIYFALCLSIGQEPNNCDGDLWRRLFKAVLGDISEDWNPVKASWSSSKARVDDTTHIENILEECDKLKCYIDRHIPAATYLITKLGHNSNAHVPELQARVVEAQKQLLSFQEHHTTLVALCQEPVPLPNATVALALYEELASTTKHRKAALQRELDRTASVNQSCKNGLLSLKFGLNRFSKHLKELRHDYQLRIDTMELVLTENQNNIRKEQEMIRMQQEKLDASVARVQKLANKYQSLFGGRVT